MVISPWLCEGHSPDMTITLQRYTWTPLHVYRHRPPRRYLSTTEAPLFTCEGALATQLRDYLRTRLRTDSTTSLPLYC